MFVGCVSDLCIVGFEFWFVIFALLVCLWVACLRALVWCSFDVVGIW